MYATLRMRSRRIVTAICLCCAAAALPAQTWAQNTEGDAQPKAEDVKTLAKEVKRLTQQMEENQSQPPTFRFQWFSYQGARLETTSEENQTYQAEIWEASGGGPSPYLGKLTDEQAVRNAREEIERGCSCSFDDKGKLQCPGGGKNRPHPLWVGRLQATKDGSSTSLQPLCDPLDDFTRILRKNGWVTIYYVPGDGTGAAAQASQVPLPAIERSTFAVELGPVFSLQNDGTWKTKPEIAVAAASRWTSHLSGFVDLRYSYTAAKSSTDTPMDNSNGGDNKADPGAADPAADDNPFASSGGTFRGNFYLEALPFATPSFGLIGGAGFSTVPAAGTSSAPLRFFGGVRLEVFAYNTLQSPDFFGNASGFFQAGYAHDRAWKFDETIPATDSTPESIVHHDDQHRIWAEGQIRFADSKDQKVVYSLRVFGDFPTNGGPYDLRVSLLASIQVQRLLGFFNSTPKG
jgi:hypothetical protein